MYRFVCRLFSILCHVDKELCSVNERLRHGRAAETRVYRGGADVLGQNVVHVLTAQTRRQHDNSPARKDFYCYEW